MQNLLDWGRGEELNLFPLNQQKEGLDRDLNPGPRAPEARIIPLDQRAYTQNRPINQKAWEKDTIYVPGHEKSANTDEKEPGSSGIWTRDLSHPKRESYP